tara:strand:- start:1801 stop:2664 length:864 start_codon:yes stop_codon:yes gene_type:complete
MVSIDHKSLIDVTNLSVKFYTRDFVISAVENISFSIQKNEILALVGESGSGKSVTALSLLRLNELSNGYISSGEIFFSPDDETRYDLSSADNKVMQQVRGNEISMIFQEPMTSLNPSLSVGTQISEVFVEHQKLSHAESKLKTFEMLKKVRIPEPEKQYNLYPHQFSGGMRQRVMIAMALSCKPQLLIADEPTTALDVTIQKQILNLIKDLQEETEMSVLFITHDMGIVAEISDRVAVMYQGKIIEYGRTSEIFQLPKNAYTRKLINSVPRLGSMRGKGEPEKFDLI